MSKNDTSTQESAKEEAQDVYVPALGKTIKAKDQADIERQVEKARAAEVSDGDS